MHLQTTFHKPLQANTSKSDREGNIIQKPSCIIDYNYNMGGEDMVDQQQDSIEVLRKSNKWYKKLFLGLLMQCVLASHKLYRKWGGKGKFLIYTLDLCTLLLQKSPRLENPLGRPPIDSIIWLTVGNLWPGKREAPDWNKMKSKIKRWRVFAARGTRTQSGNVIKTGSFCKGCSGEPGLCVDKGLLWNLLHQVWHLSVKGIRNIHMYIFYDS